MMVSDNGVGFDETPEVIKTNGFGFKNINLRVRSLDGILSIDSSKGKGTTVTIELPI
jgi:signal transduction histidine kinase